MSRVTEALKRIDLGTTLPSDPPRDGEVEAIQFFASDQATVTVPWDLGSESERPAAPETTDKENTLRLQLIDNGSELPQPSSLPATEKLVSCSTIPQVAREQYRRLAALLHQAQFEHGTRVVLVTSAVPGEGKTLTVSNLALTLSDSYRRRVLLIDADLRRPSLHTLFAVSNKRGLRNAVSSRDAPPLTEATPHLSLLTAGYSHDDPMETLASDRMRGLIDEARERFDWVLLDTPPVALLPDAKVLASLTDVVLMVARAGITAYDVIQSAVDGIGRERILGVVLNGTAETELTESYGAYYLTSADH